VENRTLEIIYGCMWTIAAKIQLNTDSRTRCIADLLLIELSFCRFTLTTHRWAATTVCPRPSPLPWAPKRIAPPGRRQRRRSFPRPTRSHAHRCSRLTRQHGGEQSGLVTLTFWPWKWCPTPSHEWRGLPLCQFWSFSASLFSTYRPDVRDR